MRLRRGALRLRAGRGRRGGTGLGMAEVDLESDQIRLKCIRKEGFFTVPPEHRVRRGATHTSPRRGKVWGPALEGTSVPELAAACAEIRSREAGAGVGPRGCDLG